MMPVTTLQGMAPEEIRDRAAGRPVFLWGGGDLAQDVLVSCRRAGLDVRGFLHSNPCPGLTSFGLPVLTLDAALKEGASLFVVIATVQFRRQALEACRERGLLPKRDVIDHFEVRRPVAVVELCRTGEPGESFGTQRPRPVPARMMALAEFTPLLHKMARDQPLLCHVQLGNFGDPLFNPEIGAIIRDCEALVPCTVTTALGHIDHLAAAVTAGASRFNVLAYGFGESYEALNGRPWRVFAEAIDRLKMLARNREGTRFLLRYLRTRNEPAGNIARWKEFLKDSPLVLSVETPYPTPYEHLMERGAVDAGGVQFQDRLTWDVETAKELARGERDRACLSQRVFPVINEDRSVAGCHLYESYRLHERYADADWGALLAARADSGFCGKCQQQGLHRLDIAVLGRRYPEARLTRFEE
jgi:hypothetical protein